VPFHYPHVVRFRETDAAGVVYFAQVLAICHDAYEAALLAADMVLPHWFTQQQLALPITHAEADYRRPLRCGDRLTITGLPQVLSDSTFEITYQVQGPDPGVAATALTRHCCIHTATRQRQPLPAPLLAWLSQAAGADLTSG
jgi:1,4-dihydroxy-2-naphthoyl-CoA hydrolase